MGDLVEGPWGRAEPERAPRPGVDFVNDAEALLVAEHMHRLRAGLTRKIPMTTRTALVVIAVLDQFLDTDAEARKLLLEWAHTAPPGGSADL